MSRRKIFIFLLVTLGVVATSSYAWNRYPFWWKQKAITMRTGALNSGGSCGGNCQSLALSAMNAWTNSCSPEPDFDWTRSTTTCNPLILDGKNCTGWGNLGQCSTGSVTLGVTFSWFTGTSAVEADVAMNSQCTFTSGEFLGVLTHENGHVMTLDHSGTKAALMYPFYQGFNTPKLDDCNGARAIYGTGGVFYNLDVSKSGTGTVTSSPSGINCGSTCSATYPQNTVVTLSASPASGWTFSNWSGNCDSGGKVTMNANKSCTANFTRIQYTLSVSKTGSGTVTSSPSGINCGSTCSSKFDSGTSVTLTPTPAANWAFVDWSGHSDCSDGKVTMNNNRSCTANFKRVYKLTVTKSGTGSGTVKSSPSGINCGGDCDEDYLENTVVVLSGIPANGSQLTGWSGAADCTDGMVTMANAKTCDAVFDTCATQSETTIKDVVISTTTTVSACNTVHVGPNVTISPTGYLKVHAGNTVIVYPVVVTDVGGKVEFILSQPMPPP